MHATIRQESKDDKSVCLLIIGHQTNVDEVANVFDYFAAGSTWVPPQALAGLEPAQRRKVQEHIRKIRRKPTRFPFTSSPGFCAISGFRLVADALGRSEDGMRGVFRRYQVHVRKLLQSERQVYGGAAADGHGGPTRRSRGSRSRSNEAAR